MLCSTVPVGSVECWSERAVRLLGEMNPVWSALLGMNAFLVDEFLSEIPFSEASPLKSFSSFCRQSYTGTLLYNVILDGGFLI